MTALAIVVVLFALALLHILWGFGVGSMSGAVPEVDGKPLFVPSRASCFVVALLLALAACLVGARGGALATPLPPSIVHVGCVGVGSIFLLRAIGDFRYVGFFKRVRGTRFARLDTRLFSPLCFALGAGSLWVALS